MTAAGHERGLSVRAAGPQCTVQDAGRPGHAAMGVGLSGAADLLALRLANRLVANPADTAALEIVLGGLRVVAHGTLTVAVTGANCSVSIDGRAVGTNAALTVPDGATLTLGTATRGLRCYLAVRGGLRVEAVLGSRSTDTLADLGPPQLVPDMWLPVGAPPKQLPNVDTVPGLPVPDTEAVLRVILGPRADWFAAEAHERLLSEEFIVTSRSDRVGMRLSGPTLTRSHDGELPSEGMVPGSVQVPPDGEPVLFLADHPVTGGYPVLAVVVSRDLRHAAQARPGTRLRFTARARSCY